MTRKGVAHTIDEEAKNREVCAKLPPTVALTCSFDVLSRRIPAGSYVRLVCKDSSLYRRNGPLYGAKPTYILRYLPVTHDCDPQPQLPRMAEGEEGV
jgi:hypothetical protein